MTTDPVTAIRMAAALNDRYGALIKSSSEIGDNVDAFELKIGEAQQLYPEIWRYLDEARAALSERADELARFDEIRATERPGQLAVTNIEGSDLINPLALVAGPVILRTKSATFNATGHHKAADACRELKAAMPEIDWRGLDRADAAEIAAAGSLTASNWKQLFTTAAILGGVLLVLVIIYKLVM